MSTTDPTVGPAEAEQPRGRGCAGCADRDQRVEQLGEDLAGTIAAMETRVFTIAGIAVGVAVVAVLVAFVAVAIARGGNRGNGSDMELVDGAA